MFLVLHPLIYESVIFHSSCRQFHQGYTRVFFVRIFRQSQKVTRKTMLVQKIRRYKVDVIDTCFFVLITSSIIWRVKIWVTSIWQRPIELFVKPASRIRWSKLHKILNSHIKGLYTLDIFAYNIAIKRHYDIFWVTYFYANQGKLLTKIRSWYIKFFSALTLVSWKLTWPLDIYN